MSDCNGCKYSKKLKYSGWPCCSCNKCEVEVRADERKKAERDFQNSDYWNDYLAKVLSDERVKILEEIEEKLNEIRYDTMNLDKRRIEHQIRAELLEIILQLKGQKNV